MAHELANISGKTSMAFIGNRTEIWHGLGQELSKDSSIETWKEEAGFNWEIEHTPAMFNVGDKAVEFKGKRVLYRSDSKEELSIVSNTYNIVQPAEVLDFFQDLVGAAGMQLSTAGVIFGGKRFWALAETNNFATINGNDDIKGNLLLTTSCDGTLATQASFVSTRVVCNNTLRLALGEDGKKSKVSHARVFDPMEIKNSLGLIDQSWNDFISNVTKLTETGISEVKAQDFIYDLVARKGILPDEQPYTVDQTVQSMMNKFKAGMGNKGQTLWDLLNGITEHYQYEMGRTKTNDVKFWSNMYGNDAVLKDLAFNKALELV